MPEVTNNSWSAISKHVSDIATAVGDIPADLHRRIPSKDLWQFKALSDTGEDIVMVTVVALKAIEDLGKLSPKIRDLWPEGGHDVEDRMRIWAADPAEHRRPQWTVIAMAATALCNVLEGFLSGVSASAIDETAIRRVRDAFPDADIEWAQPELARNKISQRMLPSTKRKGQSTKYMEAVFGCSIDPIMTQCLQSLVVFRNQVIHPKQGRAHDDHEGLPPPDQWLAWAATVHALAGTLTRALADRLDERRRAGEVILLFPHEGRQAKPDPHEARPKGQSR